MRSGLIQKTLVHKCTMWLQCGVDVIQAVGTYGSEN